MKEVKLHEKIKGPIAWMAGNSVASNLLMVVLIGGGLFFAARIKQEVFPEITMDMVTVTVPYPGSSPEEVEKGIVKAIEERVEGLDGVEEVTSRASEGAGTVTVELLLGADLQKLGQDIQNEVDRITTFPEEAEEPRVVIQSRRRDVLSLVIYGKTSEHILRELAESVRDGLLQSPEITQIELNGIRPREISVEISLENLRAYNLTLGDVAAKIRASAVEMPGGGIKTKGGEILLRVKERRDYGTEFETIPILSQPDGTHLLLGDIATITDGFADIDRFSTYNGKPAILLDVYRVGKQTPISVSTAVHTYIEENQHNMPPEIGLAVWNDRSDIYRQRMNLLLRNGFIGLVLVFILLALFLESRLAFWVTMGIPISFMGAFLVLPAMDVSLNMISMFAFIISLGIVVDDAIVVGENIYDYHQQGMPFSRAAVIGTREVSMPVIFSILTNIAAFMPLFFVPGFMGKVFKFIPAVVVIVFSISLIESIFILPSHLGHQRDVSPGGLSGWLHARQRRFSNWFARMIKNVYGPFLDLALHYRYLTLSIGIAVMCITVGFIRSGRMGMTMFPQVESDQAVVNAVLPYGSAVESTIAVQDLLISAAQRVIEENGGTNLAEGIFAEIGSGSGGASGGHAARIRVLLTPPGTRPISTAEFTKKWREYTGTVPGMESLSFLSDSGGPGSGASLTVELSHRNVDTLEKASTDLAEALTVFPNAKDINDGFSPGKKQYDFTILPAGQSLGFSAMDVARGVRNAFYGAEALRQQRGRDEVKVMVRLPKQQRVSAYDLEELLIQTPDGTDMPFRDIVKITQGRAYTVLNRRHGRRIVSVTADIEPRHQTGQVLESLKADVLPALVEKYPGLQYSFEGRQADMQESMKSLGHGFILAMFLVYALLAIPLKSYTLPMIIMISIPFGIVGAVLGHLIMGYSLSIISMMGIVALSGVVVNDSLVLMEYANRQYQSGMSAFAAVHSAGIRRFRPIMLTTLTTFGGLAPMIFETSRQARFLIPMAISLGFGILFATFISLLLVPCLYVSLEDLRRLFGYEVARETQQQS